MGTYLAQAGTFSKDNAMWGLPDDTCVMEGCDQFVRLNDDKGYLDWVCGLGSNILGYDGEFLEEVGASISLGTGFSLVHKIEYVVAEKLAKLLQANVPGWKSVPIKVRFCKTGSDATTMAIRLARAVMSNDRIITFRGMYHGWHDWTICRTPPAYGIPANTRDNVIDIEWNGDISTLDLNLRGIGAGAMIFEHPSMDAKSEWYVAIQRKAEECGALLIADEVVTGLRYGLGGACQRFNIMPDLVCMGKAMGNGFPIAAVVGPAEYLDWFNRVDPVFCSSTGWGETASLYAANYVLDNWTQSCVNQLWDTGSKLLAGMKETGWDIFGHPPRSVMRFKNEKERAFFVRHMFEHGILMNRPNFPNLCHTDEDVDKTVKAAAKGFETYSNMSQVELGKYVAGRMPRVLFSNR